MIRELDILTQDRKDIKMTTAPTRFTLKLPITLSDENRNILISFSKWIESQTRDVTKSYRAKLHGARESATFYSDSHKQKFVMSYEKYMESPEI